MTRSRSRPGERTPLTPLEQAIATKYSGASFPPATAAKRFARDFSSGYMRNLSNQGRSFMAYLVHRYRRQYKLTEDEQLWVDTWRKWTPPPEVPEEKPVKVAKVKEPEPVRERSGDLFA